MLFRSHPEAAPQVTPQVVAPAERVLSEAEIALLRFCLTARERAEMQAHLQMSDAKHLRTRYLKPLLQAGWLEMTEPDRPNSPTQQYRTTVAGQAALANATERT